MLKRIEIKNFRSCHDVVLDDLGPLTVLVGRNAAGKSNILRAISWLANTATSLVSPSGSELGFAPAGVSLQVSLGRDVYDYSLEAKYQYSAKPGSNIDIVEVLHHQNGDGARKQVFTTQEGKVLLDDGRTIIIGSSTPCMPALVSVMPPNSDTVRLIRPLLSTVEAIRYYPLSVEGEGDYRYPIVRHSDYSEWLARHSGTGSLGTAVVMRLLDMRLTREDQFNEVRDLLGPNGLGLVNDIHVEQHKPASQKEEDWWYSLRFQPSDDPALSVGFPDLSSGTQRLVGIVTSLIYDQSAVMLLEHPEDGIHRALLRKLIGLLQTYSDQSQLIIASHSAVVFNTVTPGAIRLVTLEHGATKLRALTQKELQVAARYLEDAKSRII